MKRIMILCLMAALLWGCSPAPAQPDVAEPAVPSESLPAVSETPTLPIETQAVVNTVTYQYHTEEAKEFARIIASDQNGNEVWVYETPHYDMGQVVQVSAIGSWNDRYFFVEDHAVVALDLATGEVLWKNSDFGGSPAGADAVLINDDGTVYLCGFFGPDFFAVSAEGKTLKKIDDLSAEYYWAHKLEKKDFSIIVYFSGGPEGDMGPEAYSVSIDLPLT